jgi:serine/threonine protein kinase
MPTYEIGVATEIDQEEAFLPLTILRRTFLALYILLVASAIAIFVFTVIVARLQREARRAAVEAQQLGQYTLDEKLGAGAMGVVYKGHHAMLRRPTAIKLLDADKVNDASIQRFEREVQITCRLNHPSTVAIYDYGRTPEGVFYYAMEYLDGIDLQDLVEQYGAQPGGRVVSILRQVCGSLYEAHTQGLVHRDIKPANIMLSRRGGEPDVVKVLDFGLVKAIDDQKQAGASAGDGLTGTPLYMSPEAIQSPVSVDGRSDLYGVGAVGYFLLTGKPVFDAESIVDLCQKHVDEVPIRPSKRLGRQISSELEHALLSCLEKSRAKRPQTARDLAQLLKKCPEAANWSPEEADAWWGRHERRQTEEDDSSEDTTSGQTGYEQTIALDSN